MKKSFIPGYVLIVVCLNIVSCGQQAPNIVIGQRAALYSRILDKEIELSLHVPEEAGSYPVLITFQTHFEQVAGAAKHLYEFRLTPPMMVVSIDNYEYGYLTPTTLERDPNTGKADEFLRFFDEELFPFLENQYGTIPYHIVFSNSWGGLFGVYAILAEPNVFNATVASIPWVIYDGDERYIINHTGILLAGGGHTDRFLFMTADNETDLLPELEIFVDSLRANAPEGLEWYYEHWPEEDHTSTPYRSLHTALRTLFRGWGEIPEEIVDRGLQGIIDHEQTLNNKFGYEIGVSTSGLRMAGQKLQQRGAFEEAIEIFKYAVDKSPQDAFGHLSLGRAYEAGSQLEEARRVYEDAYRIAVSTSHPQVNYVKNFLDQINN